MEEDDSEDPCETCEERDYCDAWEAQFCCTLCCYMNGGEEPPWCDECDPMDI
jgi:hypothetical protein